MYSFSVARGRWYRASSQRFNSRLVRSESVPVRSIDLPVFPTRIPQQTLWPALPPAPVTRTLFNPGLLGLCAERELISREVPALEPNDLD